MNVSQRMSFAVYTAVTTVAAPFGAFWLLLNPRHRSLLARFSPRVGRFDARPIWVHACSVGEVNVANPLLRALAGRFPGVPLLLSTSTTSGKAFAEETIKNATVCWFPFDHAWSVRGFLRDVNPRALILVETEIWPNVVRESRRFGIPVILANGRISDRKWGRYKRSRFFFRHVFLQLSAAAMQNQEYANRIELLGVPKENICVTGNTKFDGADTSTDMEQRVRFRRELGIADKDPILVFGSTRPGDEDLAVQCWRKLKDEIPNLVLIIALRHPQRKREVLGIIKEESRCRSEMSAGEALGGERILIVDTVGELMAFYRIATIAIIGGSFFPGVNGHNPIEPAGIGVPTVFGPYMRNFADPVEVLLANGGAAQVSSPDALTGVLQHLLNSTDERQRMGECGRAAIVSQQGAKERTIDLIQRVLSVATAKT